MSKLSDFFKTGDGKVDPEDLGAALALLASYIDQDVTAGAVPDFNGIICRTCKN